MLDCVGRGPFVSRRSLTAGVNLSHPTITGVVSNLIEQKCLLKGTCIVGSAQPVIYVNTTYVSHHCFIRNNLVRKRSGGIASRASVNKITLDVTRGLNELRRSIIVLSLIKSSTR